MKAEGLLALLRSGTDELHKRVERSTEMAQLVSSELGVETYRSIIQKKHSFYSSYEPIISEFDFEGYTYKSKLPWLEADLNELNAGPIDAEVDMKISSFDEAIGSLYVIEGSMLGGQVISRNLAKVLPGLEHKFFNGNGSSTRENWLSFIEYVSVIESKVDQERSLEGAKDTFLLIERLFKHDESKTGSTVSAIAE